MAHRVSELSGFPILHIMFASDIKCNMEKTRNELIFEAYANSVESCFSIGKRFSLTKQRVIQIAKEMGATPRAYEPGAGETGWAICKVDGCGEISRSRWSMLCNKHYFRGRRTGSTADRERQPPSPTNHGYMAQNWKAHPASSKGGMLYEHRKVFYETFGPDGHSCFWCQVPLEWGGGGTGKLHVDHLNGEKSDNQSSNLVPSCHRCNVNRGLFMSWFAQHKDDPVILSMLRSNLLTKSL